MNEKRGAWHLLTGLIIGGLIGLLISIKLVPVNYIDTEPYALKPADRDLYRKAIAMAYLVEADPDRALTRLALLQDVSSADALVAQAQKELSRSGSEADSRALALLAEYVREGSVQITPLPRAIKTTPPTQTLAPTATIVSTTGPTPTSASAGTTAPAATNTPVPTATIQPTMGPQYELVEQEEVCDSTLSGGLIQVYVAGAGGKSAAGVRIEVSIPDGGAETFFTGFHPEIDPGYADYQMADGMTYNLKVGDTGQLIQNLSIPQCRSEEGISFPGSLLLRFGQP